MMFAHTVFIHRFVPQAYPCIQAANQAYSPKLRKQEITLFCAHMVDFHSHGHIIIRPMRS